MAGTLEYQDILSTDRCSNTRGRRFCLPDAHAPDILHVFSIVFRNVKEFAKKFVSKSQHSLSSRTQFTEKQLFFLCKKTKNVVN